MDQRFNQLAAQVIGYSVSLKPGEKVLIDVWDGADDLGTALMEAAYAAGGMPFVTHQSMRMNRSVIAHATDAYMQDWLRYESYRMREMDAYIVVRKKENLNEWAGIDPERMAVFEKYYSQLHFGIRIPKTKWCVLRWPNPSMAQGAGMSTESFEDFYFRCCLTDYASLRVAMDKLAARMMATDKVHIVGPGTDLTFSIKGMPALPCDGILNIPDGEVYTAPVRDSVNGVLSYNAPSIYNGIPFDGVKFRFENGKIVEAHCNGDEKKLNDLLNTDEGARYIGEFALGVNPYVLHPMRDILFDEKIAGSFHFTPGQCYEEAPNGNESSIHWDLVCIQRADYGGGEIYFDGELIRKDGIFVDPELAILNPAE